MYAAAAAAAPSATAPAALLSRLVAGPDASESSGQPGGSAFGAALAGSPMPLGATYLQDQVSTMRPFDIEWKKQQDPGSFDAHVARPTALVAHMDINCYLRLGALAPRTHHPKAPAQGVTNFAVFSSAASAVSLVLFTESDLAAGRPTHELALDPARNRSGDTWHIALPGLDSTLLYGACLV